jgi:hypothetical protein
LAGTADHRAIGHGRLDQPPPAAAYLDLPADFGRRFLVFVDTEEEFDWSAPRRREGSSTTATRALPEIQQRFRAAGIEPVYLVDYPVAGDPRSVAILRGFVEAGEALVGAQLHPWVNPPFEEQLTAVNSFAGNLPPELEHAKLAELTDLLERGIGRRPWIYRAGRYGVGPNTAQLLDQLGYDLDVSVRARFDYSEEGGPDFSAFEPRPYWAGPSRNVLELPLSAAYVGLLRDRGAALFSATRRYPLSRGVLARTRLLARVPLSPEGTSPGEAVAAIHRLIEDGVRAISLSFHSPSLVPGHTPYVRNASDLRAFNRWWDVVLDFLATAGIEPAGAMTLMQAAERARAGLASPPAPPLGVATDMAGPVAQR